MNTKNLGKPIDNCPKGKFPKPLKATPRPAVHLLSVAGRIRDLTNEQGLRSVARAANVSESTLSRTVNGEIWPSAVTIASVEAAFDIELW